MNKELQQMLLIIHSNMSGWMFLLACPYDIVVVVVVFTLQLHVEYHFPSDPKYFDASN